MVAQNVAALRRERHLSVRALSARMGELGVPLLPSGITKIEAGNRGVSVGELVALALALRVTPNRLMLPVDGGEMALTPATTATAMDAWDWTSANSALLSTYPEGTDQEEATADLRHHSQWSDHSAKVRDTTNQVVKAVLVEELRPIYDKIDELTSKAQQSEAKAQRMLDALRGLKS